jgi:16S rRNA (guanine527-N7)-methyltransferase
MAADPSISFLTTLGTSKEAFEKLKKYVELIRQWNKAINLVAPSTLDDIWNRHILDSVQLFTHVGKFPVIDLGSGGGLPGLVLAILGAPVTMIESDTRKCVFLAEAARTVGLEVSRGTPGLEWGSTQAERGNVWIINDRIENVHGITAPVITARALAPLKTLVEWASPLLSPGGKMIFLKGQDVKTELVELPQDLRDKVQLIPSLTDGNARIVII